MATVVGNGTESAYRTPYIHAYAERARARALSGNRIMLIRILRRAVEIRSRASASLARIVSPGPGRRPGFAREPSQVDTIRAGCSHPPGFLFSLSLSRLHVGLSRIAVCSSLRYLSLFLSLSFTWRSDPIRRGCSVR